MQPRPVDTKDTKDTKIRPVGFSLCPWWPLCRVSAADLALTAFILAGCSAGAEESTLNQFFAASRLHDKTTLGELSTVAFEPTTQGIVTTFTITNVSPEKHDGELVSKDVTIDAPVRVPSGATVRKKLIVTIQRAQSEREKAITGGWIVTGIKDASAAAATRPS